MTESTPRRGKLAKGAFATRSAKVLFAAKTQLNRHAAFAPFSYTRGGTRRAQATGYGSRVTGRAAVTGNRSTVTGRLVLTSLLAITLATGFAAFTKPARTAAATPNTINFQARLQSSGGAIVPDGDYNVEFKLYNTASSSGSGQGSCSGDADCLWTETRTYNGGSPDRRVSVANGYLTVNLGSVNPLPTDIWNQQLWLTMRIGGSGTTASWDTEMSPRLSLTAVPAAYALTNTSGSVTSSLTLQPGTGSAGLQDFIVPDQGAPGTYNLCVQNSSDCGFIQNATSVQTGANFNIDGNGVIGGTLAVGYSSIGSGVAAFNGDVGIGTDSPSAPLEIAVSGSDFKFSQNSASFQSTTGSPLIVTLSKGTCQGIVRLTSSGGDLTIGSNSGCSSTTTHFTIQNSGDVTQTGSLTVQGANVTVGSSSLAGSLVINDGAGNTVSIMSATQANSVAITVPADTNASDTLCLQTLGNCGGGTYDGTDFIVNGTSLQSSANFNITGAANASPVAKIDVGSSTGNILQVGDASFTGFYVDNTGNNRFKGDSFFSGFVQFAQGIDTTSAGALDIGYTSGGNATAINLNQNTTITGNLSFAVGANRTVSVATQTAANTAGNNLTVSSATGNGTGNGGTLTLSAGNSGAGATGNGGAISIAAGNAASTNGNGGNVTIDAGTKTGSGTNGTVSIGTTSASGVTVGNTSGSMTLQGTGALTLAGFTSIKEVTTALSFDLNNASNSTLTVTNSGAGQGNLSVKSNVTVGALATAGIVTNTAAGLLGTVAVVPVANGGTNNSSFSATNGVIYYDGTKLTNTAASTGAQCLQTASAGSAPIWGSCGSSAISLGAVDSAGSANNNGATLASNVLNLNSADGTHPGVVNASTQSFGGNKTFLGTLTVNPSASSTAFQVQNANGSALVFDTSAATPVLKVYGSGGPTGAYAQIYYDTANSKAVFAASSGTTQIGTGGSVTGNLTGATDVYSFNTTYTPSATYSQSNFSVLRTLTGGTNTLGGNLLNVTDNSTVASGGTVNPTLLLLNQASIGAGTIQGNLIDAQLAGVSKLSVTTAGNVTAAGSLTVTGLASCGSVQTSGAGLFSCGTAAVSLGAYSTTNTDAHGATLSAGVLTFQDASASAPGMVGTGTQTFAGVKTFSSRAVLSAGVQVAASQTIDFVGGITGSRPASPTEGQLYYDTTTHSLVQYNGSKWVSDRSTATKIVGTSASGGTSSAVASQNPDAADYVNTSTTSAQTTINSAISALPSTGGTVYLMEGTYIIDGSVTLKDNVTLVGSGAGTVIKLKNGINAAINAIANSNTTTGSSNITISNVALDGNQTNNTSGSQDGIHLNSSGAANYGTIKNIYVHDFRNNGIYLTSLYHFTIESNRLRANGTGLSLYTEFYGTISGNNIDVNGIGIQQDLAENITIGNNVISSSTGIGLKLQGDSGWGTITGNHIISNAGGGIYMSDGAHEVISNNQLYDNGSSGANDSIKLFAGTGAYCDTNTVTGNNIEDTAGTGYAINIANSTCNKNYLSNNTFSGTGATSISDSGTGTVYANQARAVDGGQLTVRTANDTQALQVQTATGTAVLTVDTTNSAVNIQTIAAGDAATIGSELATSPTCTGTNWSGTGPWTHTAGSTTALSCTPPASVTSGAYYQVIFTTGGSPTAGEYVYARVGGSGGGQSMYGNVTADTEVIKASGTTSLQFVPTSSWNGTISSISLKLVTPATSTLSVQSSDGASQFELRVGNSTNDKNTFLGLQAGQSNTTGYENTATGAYALQSNTTGYYNVANGDSALQSNTTGHDNTATGVSALWANTTGSYNTAFGSAALELNSTGANNTATGVSALQANTTGSFNTAGGTNALSFNTTGHDNTATGYSALTLNTTGYQNTATGDSALYNNLTGTNNTATGNLALFSNTTGYYNTATGDSALYRLATLSGSITATVTNGGNAKFTTGSTSGMKAGMTVTISGTTSYNGAKTVASVDDGTHFTISTAFSTADSAGNWVSNDPVGNTATGYSAGYGSSSNYVVQGSTLYGYQAGFAMQTGADYNTLIGYGAGSAITTGNTNLLLGKNAGANLTTGSNNIIIGSVNAASATGSNQLLIGSYISGDLSTGTLAIKAGTAGNTFQVQNTGGNALLNVDTSGNNVLIGKAGTLTGVLQFANATGANVVGLQAGASTAAYTLTLPTTGPSTSQCLQTDATTATLLKFGSCGSGGGDNITVNGSAATDANFLNTTATGSVAGTTWSINTASNPDDITLAISVASGTVAGVVDTNNQTFAGAKTFTGNLTVQPANSTTALQVQNSNAQIILAVDTTANQLTLNGNINMAQVSGPASAPTLNSSATAGSLTGTFYYVYTYVTAAGETNYSAESTSIGPVTSKQIVINITTSGSGLVTARKVYRSTTSGGPYQLVGTVSNNTATTFTDNNTSPTTTASNINKTGGVISLNGTMVVVSDPVSFNTGVGYQALTSNTTGYDNTASGGGALQANTIGFENTATGYSTLQSNTSGHDNTASGALALLSNTSGNNNTATGAYALQFNTTGSGNTAVGELSLTSNTTGSKNIALGYSAGNLDSSGFFATGATLQNATAIGSYAQVQASNSIVLGSIDTATKVGIGTTIPLNTFSVSPVDYSTGTAGTNGSASTTVTGSSTSWTSAMIGEQFIFQDGQTGTITAVASGTSLTLSASVTETGTTQHYRIHHIGFQVKNDGTAYLQQTSTTALQVQNTAGTTVLGVDTSANKVLVGTAGAAQGNLVISGSTSGSITITTAAAAGTYTLILPTTVGAANTCLGNSATPGTLTWNACSGGGGGGGSTHKVYIIPEYAGGVLSADGSNNSGTMTSDYDSTNRHNYYSWVNSTGTLNDYDIVARNQIPAEYASGLGSFKIWTYTSDTTPAAGTDEDILITVKDGSGTACATSTSVLPTAGTTWEEKTVTLSGCTFAASDILTITIHVVSKSSNAVRVGEISYTYTN